MVKLRVGFGRMSLIKQSSRATQLAGYVWIEGRGLSCGCTFGSCKHIGCHYSPWLGEVNKGSDFREQESFRRELQLPATDKGQPLGEVAWRAKN